MINYGITSDNLIRTLPEVLRNDDKMRALATVIANALSYRTEEIEKLSIYSQIDMLPETLLDILAYDFKVDWYGYDYGIDAKRAQIKDGFNVHRHLGTRGAAERALSDIYPGTEVEEWFDYGGDPYYFRVLLDVTDQRVSISHDEIIRTIELFKSRRSHLQDDTVIYRSRVHIAVGVTTGYVLYGARLCGTYPVRATQGAISDEGIILLTDADGAVYTVPKSGEIKTGSYPATATQGGVESGGISIDTSGDSVAYSVRPCGTALGSII